MKKILFTGATGYIGRRLLEKLLIRPRGVWGRVYRYSVSPLHNLVFADLARQIVAHAARSERKSEA